MVYVAGTARRLGHPVQGKKHVTTHHCQFIQRLMQWSQSRRHVTVQTGTCCLQSLPGFTCTFCKMYVVMLLRLFLFFFFHRAANIISLRRFVVSQSIAVFGSPPFWGLTCCLDVIHSDSSSSVVAFSFKLKAAFAYISKF